MSSTNSNKPPEELTEWLPEDGFENDEQENINEYDPLEGVDGSEIGC